MYVGGKKVQFRADDLPHIEARMHALTHMHINAKTKISMCFDVHVGGEILHCQADDLPHIEFHIHTNTHGNIRAKARIWMYFYMYAVGEKVQYRADDLPHGLRDHSICQYMLAMNHSIPKCPQDEEMYAYYSSRAVSTWGQVRKQ